MPVSLSVTRGWTGCLRTAAPLADTERSQALQLPEGTGADVGGKALLVRVDLAEQADCLLLDLVEILTVTICTP
jgi:hypothetical protein